MTIKAMNHTRITICLAVAALALSAMLTSCIEDGFTTSPNDRLAFNTDTVAFDTVITQQGTATKQMVVYNHSKKQVNISSIKVAGEADRAWLTINGAGDIDATGLEAASIRPSVHGVGSVRTR